MSEVKQVIVIRKDLRMRRGKEIAQGSHASMAWLTKRLAYMMDKYAGWTSANFSDAEQKWLTGRFAKVVCQTSSLEELTAVEVAALEAGLEVHVITDSGRTEFGGVPTVTCLAVGPDYADKVDTVTGHLTLY